MLDSISAVTTAEITISSSTMNYVPAIWQSELPNCKTFPVEEFLRISFTHHIAIIANAATLEERCYYIKLCADEALKADTLIKFMKQDVFHNQGAMPNNFMAKLDDAELARRAILAFKDEYLLDFINVEELGARNIEDVDERVVENKIVQNIKNFIMTFGHDFAFMVIPVRGTRNTP